jgi:hypothetical protein
MRTRLHALGVLLLTLLVGAGPVSASIITLDLTGTVTSVQSPLAGTFHLGDAAHVTVVYDTTTPAAATSLANPTEAIYDFISFGIQFGGYTASFATGASATNPLSSEIIVANDSTYVNTQNPFAPADAFAVSSFGLGTGAAVTGVPLAQGFLTLLDATSTALNSLALPSALSLAQFGTLDAAGLSFCKDSSCGVGSLLGIVEATLTSLSVTTSGPGNTAPEPGTVSLVLSAVGLMAFARRRRRARPADGGIL